MIRSTGDQSQMYMSNTSHHSLHIKLHDSPIPRTLLDSCSVQLSFCSAQHQDANHDFSDKTIACDCNSKTWVIVTMKPCLYNIYILMTHCFLRYSQVLTFQIFVWLIFGYFWGSSRIQRLNPKHTYMEEISNVYAIEEFPHPRLCHLCNRDLAVVPSTDPYEDTYKKTWTCLHCGKCAHIRCVGRVHLSGRQRWCECVSTAQ